MKSSTFMSADSRNNENAAKIAGNTANFKRLSLKANFSWTFVGNSIYAATQWFLLMLFAKLGTVEMVGQFSLGLAVTAPIVLLSQLQLRSVYVTDNQENHSFSDYLATRLLLTVLAFALIFGIGLSSGYEMLTFLTVLLVGVAKLVEGVSDICFGVMQRHEQMQYIAISQTIKGLFSLTVVAIVLWLNKGIIVAMLGYVGVRLLLLAYERVQVIRIFQQSQCASKRPVNKRSILSIVKVAFPLGIAMMFISLNTNIPRYFLERSHGESALGYFASLSYVLVAGSMVVGALGQALTPRLSRYFAVDRERFFRLLVLLVLIGATIGLLAVLAVAFWGQDILTLIYTQEYAYFNRIFLWITIASAIGFVNSGLGYTLTAMRRFSSQAYMFFLSAVVALLFSWLLVPDHGIYGATLVLMVVMTFQLVASCIIIARATKRPKIP